MAMRKPLGLADVPETDDAPMLTADMLAGAEVFDGEVFVRRVRGRPKGRAVKEQVSVHLDADVLAKLRAAGPGWQAQISDLLREAIARRGRPE